MAKSPCVDVCLFDRATGWCAGCGWTLKEAAGWKKLTPYRRVALEREMKRRLASARKGSA